MSNPKGSSAGWRQRQERDPYVQRARDEGYRSRAVYKLEELLEKARLPGRPGLVIDLGAAPGAWSQYVVRRWGEKTRVLALDILPMDEIRGVEFLQGDFTESEVLQRLTAELGGEQADLVLSDMAPNISGNRSVDQPRAMYLAELAMELACDTLSPGGTFLCKVFQGEGFDDFVRAARERFRQVRVIKPKASRPSSREVYLLARNYQL